MAVSASFELNEYMEYEARSRMLGLPRHQAPGCVNVVVQGTTYSLSLVGNCSGAKKASCTTHRSLKPQQVTTLQCRYSR